MYQFSWLFHPSAPFWDAAFGMRKKVWRIILVQKWVHPPNTFLHPFQFFCGFFTRTPLSTICHKGLSWSRAVRDWYPKAVNFHSKTPTQQSSNTQELHWSISQTSQTWWWRASLPSGLHPVSFFILDAFGWASSLNLARLNYYKKGWYFKFDKNNCFIQKYYLT